MKKNRYTGIMMLAAAALAVASCSEFDDYNKEVTDVTTSGNQTLWENIEQNPQLSTFASLLKKTGYADKLNTTHYYTVWAPIDGSYDLTDIQQMDDEEVQRQFVENHIADYGHLATGAIDERVMMLNSKSYDFQGSGNSYTFDGVSIGTPNLGSNNGVLHLMNGRAAYYPSLYEFITSPKLSGAYEIDSLRNYVERYELTTLDEEHSVLGPIVGGLQTYVDSVMITENALWVNLNTRMQAEDSTYTFLMPNNTAWEKQYEKVKACYNYVPSVVSQLFTTNGTQTTVTTSTPLTIDAAYWQDSLTSRAMTRYLSYSNKDAYNRWLTGQATSLGSDTLRTTLGAKLSNPQDILAGTVAEVPMSNGRARIIGEYGMYPWETYAPERNVQVSSANNRAQVSAGTGIRVDVIDPDPTKVQLEEGETTLSYYDLPPTGNSEYVKPELTIYLRNVLSTTYDIYCVFVPEHVSLSSSDAVTKPNRVIFTLNYCDASGALKNQLFLNPDEEQAAAFKARFPGVTYTNNAPTTNVNYQTAHAFSNDTSKVDTLYVGEFTFPICYNGLGDDYCPNIKITSPYPIFNADLRAAYTAEMRIAAIILKPKELVEFEEQNKQ